MSVLYGIVLTDKTRRNETREVCFCFASYSDLFPSFYPFQLRLRLIHPIRKTIKQYTVATVLAIVGAAAAAAPSTPVSNVQVTLKGKKYQIDDVTTVRELQERLEEQSGIVPSKQGKILHQGKRVNNDVSLTEAGVVEGDQLNCVPAKKSSSSSGSKKKSSSTTRSSSAPSTVASAGAAGSAADDDDAAAVMQPVGLHATRSRGVGG